MTKARATHPDGRRKLSEETKAKLSEANRRRFAAMTPEQQAAQLARIGRQPRGSKAGPDDPKDPAPGATVGVWGSTPWELLRRIRLRG